MKATSICILELEATLSNAHLVPLDQCRLEKTPLPAGLVQQDNQRRYGTLNARTVQLVCTQGLDLIVYLVQLANIVVKVTLHVRRVMQAASQAKDHQNVSPAHPD